jgi:hypothetical protein
MDRRIPAAAALHFLLAACGDGSSTEPLVPTALQLDRESVVLEVQETVVVHAQILDQYGDVLTGEDQITWSASNSSVAQVSAGTITGVGPGVATVSAQAEGLSAEVEVTVEARELTGELSFDYAGGHSGSYGVSETFRLDLGTGGDLQDWAVTFYFNEFQSQDIVSERVREDGLRDLVWFWVDLSIEETGTHDLDGAFIFFGVQDSQTWEFAYEDMLEGTVEFTSVTSDRVEGTFAFELEAPTGETLSVTSGAFDVPRVSEAEVGIASTAEAVAGAQSFSHAELRRRMLDARR